MSLQESGVLGRPRLLRSPQTALCRGLGHIGGPQPSVRELTNPKGNSPKIALRAGWGAR